MEKIRDLRGELREEYACICVCGNGMLGAIKFR
jgi:hypothetical protein